MYRVALKLERRGEGVSLPLRVGGLEDNRLVYDAAGTFEKIAEAARDAFYEAGVRGQVVRWMERTVTRRGKVVEEEAFGFPVVVFGDDGQAMDWAYVRANEVGAQTVEVADAYRLQATCFLSPVPVAHVVEATQQQALRKIRAVLASGGELQSAHDLVEMLTPWMGYLHGASAVVDDMGRAGTVARTAVYRFKDESLLRVTGQETEAMGPPVGVWAEWNRFLGRA